MADVEILGAFARTKSADKWEKLGDELGQERDGGMHGRELALNMAYTEAAYALSELAAFLADEAEPAFSPDIPEPVLADEGDEMGEAGTEPRVKEDQFGLPATEWDEPGEVGQG